MWHLELAARSGDGREADAGRGHLQERERAWVVTGRDALHGRDLECLEDGVAEHEEVAEGRAARDAVQKQEPDDRERDPEPERARYRSSEED